MTPDEKDRVTTAVRRLVDARELMATVNLITAADEDDERAEVVAVLVASLAEPLRRRAVVVDDVRAMILIVASW